MSAKPKVLPINSPELRTEVVAAGKTDNHDVGLATHYLRRGSEVVGAWNLGALPLVMNWHHSKKINVRDSLYLQETLDALMREKGHLAYMSICTSDSPYRRYMERVGYNFMLNTDIFIKSTEDK